MNTYEVTVSKDGTRRWKQNGRYHRLDGPAIELSDGRTEYWIDGIEYSKKDFGKEVTRRNNPCEGKTVEIDGVKYLLTKI